MEKKKNLFGKISIKICVVTEKIVHTKKHVTLKADNIGEYNNAYL
tara:strand:+ start:1419 stop:1553 length:135 start_codon:yes stop_codon:yes gene_type:complete